MSSPVQPGAKRCHVRRRAASPELTIRPGCVARHLLLKKHPTRNNYGHLAQRFWKRSNSLRRDGLPHLVQSAEMLDSWQTEIATISRFTRNNGNTERPHQDGSTAAASLRLPQFRHLLSKSQDYVFVISRDRVRAVNDLARLGFAPESGVEPLD